MYIVSCYIENFGRLSAQKFDFSRGMNTLCRDNGWGKTTLLAFIKAMFYGLPSSRSRDLFENERLRYRPWQGGLFGGSMTFCVGERTYRCERTFGDKEASDTFSLMDEETRLPSDDFGPDLGYTLFGVDAAGFERSTCFSERSDRVKADYSDIQARLVNLSDFSACDEAIKKLDEARQRYWKKGNRGLVPEMQSRLYAAEGERKEALEQARRWNEGEERRRALTREAEALMEERDAISRAAAALGERKVAAARQEQATDMSRRIAVLETQLAAMKAEKLPEAEQIDAAEEAARALCDRRARQSQSAAQEMARRAVAREMAREKLKAAQKEAREAQEAYAAAALRARRARPFLLGASGLAVIAVVLAVLAHWIPAALLLLSATAGAVYGLCAAKAAREALTLAQKRREDCLACESAEEPETEAPADVPGADPEEEVLRSFAASLCPAHDIPAEPEAILGLVAALREKTKRAAALEAQIASEKEALAAFSARHPSAEGKQPLPNEDEAALAARESACVARQKKVAEELQATQSAIAPLLSGAERLPLLEQEIADLHENLPQREQRLEALRKAMEYLTAAKNRLTAGYLDTVQAKFGDYVAKVAALDPETTAHTYRLSPSFEVSLDTGGATHSGDAVSRGTRDLLALCLRLALRDAIFTREEPPLLLDDPFLSYDDAKTKAALAFLHQLSEGRQILYCVCHTSRA